MKRHSLALIALLFIVVSKSLGGVKPLPPVAPAAEAETTDWEGSLSTVTYFAVHSHDYVNPNLTLDRDWLHLEARYNYEALKTGSIWLGYNFGFGEKLVLDATPMLGGVFGNSTGIAPGYTIAISYKSIEFFTQGEYFIDAGTHSENFFYTWSELSFSPLEWFKIGLVVDRTKALGSNIDVRRGPLVGVKYRKLDFTTYWLSPGSPDAAFVFAVTAEF